MPHVHGPHDPSRLALLPTRVAVTMLMAVLLLPAVPSSAAGASFGSVTAGSRHVCGAQGVAHCWGADDHGQLGDGVAGPASATPVVVAGGLVLSDIGAGTDHTCGLDDTGR